MVKTHPYTRWLLLSVSVVSFSLFVSGVYGVAHAADCSTITTLGQVPLGYGAPFNVFTGHRLLGTTCLTSNFTVSVDGGSETALATYTTGYYWSGTQWKSYSLQGSSSGTGSWVMNGPAVSVASIPYQGDQTYIVAYTCLQRNGQWKCGCRDSSCAKQYWQLQLVQKPTSTSATACGPYPTPSKISSATGLSVVGYGQIKFTANDGKSLTAYTYRDKDFNPRTGKILFVMHGSSRTAESYAQSAATRLAQDNDALIIAPEFPKSLYPNASDYNRNMRNFETIESLFEATVRTLGGTQNGYYLYGNSAGAQFVQRLLMNVTDHRVLGAASAGGGATTVPFRSVPYAYGLKGTELEKADLRHYLSANLAIVIGDQDTATCEEDDSVVCYTNYPERGINRLERSKYLYNESKKIAVQEGVPYGWNLVIVPNVGHSAGGTMDPAEPYIFKNKTVPQCTR